MAFEACPICSIVFQIITSRQHCACIDHDKSPIIVIFINEYITKAG